MQKNRHRLNNSSRPNINIKNHISMAQNNGSGNDSQTLSPIKHKRKPKDEIKDVRYK